MVIESMKHSPVRNYGGIPGLTSWLIGEPSAHGLVRLMDCSRDHFEPIVPHSHRFDFECRVLAGSVRNILWEPSAKGDEYEALEVTYSGAPGEYAAPRPVGRSIWRYSTNTYHEGETYSMFASEIHSIFFSRGTQVLFFEGPQTTSTSLMLQPVVGGETIPTFKVEPWMFKHG